MAADNLSDVFAHDMNGARGQQPFRSSGVAN